MTRPTAPTLGLLLAAAALAAGDDVAPPSFSERERRAIASMSPLPPVPANPTNAFADEPRAARLGQLLFFDARLSSNGEVSCATCHDPQKQFTDGRQRGRGLDDVARHTPSLWNVAHNRWFFWDGRADTLWAQALEPIEDPREMGGDRLAVAHLLAGDARLRAAYEDLFGPLPDLADASRFPARGRPAPPGAGEDEMHRAFAAMAAEDRGAVNEVFANVGKALEAYQRRLVRADAPFDRFAAALAAGDTEGLGALTAAQQRGLKLFVGKANCRLCHLGPMLSDGEFHSTGIGPVDGGPLHDEGRYEGIRRLQESPFNAAGAFSDDPDGPRAEATRTTVRTTEQWGQFKTPSLRNVALTAPYMHEGQLPDLAAVVRHYSTLENAVLPGHHREQLLAPLNLTEEEQDDLVQFLHALTALPPDPALLLPPPLPAVEAAAGARQDR